MAGVTRNAGSNLRLCQSGLLTKDLGSFKIRKVEGNIYTLEKDGKVVVLKVE